MHWTLRRRLLAAFSVLASLIMFVGLASYFIHGTVRDGFHRLSTGSHYDLTTHDSARVGLEVQGYWDPTRGFIATDILPQPPQEPRLRGAIQAIDHDAETIRLYGIDVFLTGKTENGDEPTDAILIGALQIGQRVEVKCEVTDNRWFARKIYIKDVRGSNKVKGMVTAKELDGEAPESVFFHSLEIIVTPREASGVKSALVRVEQASRLLVQLQACRSAAFSIAAQANQDLSIDHSGEILEMQLANQRFGEMLSSSREHSNDAEAETLLKFSRHLDKLHEAYLLQTQHVVHMSSLASSPGTSPLLLDYVLHDLTPFLDSTIVPRLTAYLWEAEEELGDQMRAALRRAELTPRLAVGVSLLALVVSVLLGWWLWRSIKHPLDDLQAAAVSIGSGNLDTRIEARREDEFGMLSEAFNKMASDLSSSTFSITSMESVLNSMASALIVFDTDERIIRVNHATCSMTGLSRAELLGHTFDVMCFFKENESVGPLTTVVVGEPQADKPVAYVEREFIHKEGHRFPVAVSGVQLGGQDGSRLGAVCVAQDLSDSKRIQEDLRHSLAEKELLLREVHHRVKNNMQVISSLLAMQADQGNGEIARYLEESQSRVRTIALIHEHLYLSSELAQIELEGYISGLTNHLVVSYGKRETVAVALEIEDLDLDIDQALSVGLIVNELVTNSLKYAFEAGTAGTLRISTKRDPDGRCTLTVSDNGCGYEPSQDGRKNSLGTILVQSFAKKLKGTVHITSSPGTTTRIEFHPPKGTPPRGGTA